MIKNIFKIKIIEKWKRGFTLIEALVSITILVVIFTAPLGLAFKMDSKFDYLQKKIVANSLAQEGMEIVTAFRANALISCLRAADCDSQNSLVAWMSFVQNIQARCQNGCAADLASVRNSILADGSIDYSVLELDTTCANMYSHDTGPYTCMSNIKMLGEAQSGYARSIKIVRMDGLPFSSPVTGDTELLVTSSISFVAGGVAKTINIKTILKKLN